MSLGANTLPTSVERACTGDGDMTSATGQSLQQRSTTTSPMHNDSLKCSCNSEASAKAKWEMKRNTLSHPKPSVPIRLFLLFYNLTYCSKSQIFRNSTGWRYYQEKRSASAKQCNCGVISRRLRQWWQKLENQNTKGGSLSHSDTLARNSRTDIWQRN